MSGGIIRVGYAIAVMRNPTVLRTALPLVAVVLLSSCSPQPDAAVSLSPVPFAMSVPPALAPRLQTGPIEGPFGQEVERAGALASTTLSYRPVEQGEEVIFLTAYWFPADKFDALQSPEQPPLFGTEVLRQDGNVLSVAGPVDAIFASDTPDGRNLTALYGVIHLPETYRADD